MISILPTIYNVIYLAVVSALTVFVLGLLARVAFSYADPNPFGKMGRFAFWLKRKTDPVVIPAAGFLSQWRIERRFAPVLTIIIACFIVWVGLAFLLKIFVMVNGIAGSVETESVSSAFGYFFSGLISIYIFLILLRLVSIFAMKYSNPVRMLLGQICDPVLVPARRLIPTVGMFDISAIIVMLMLSVLQTLIERLLIKTYIPF